MSIHEWQTTEAGHVWTDAGVQLKLDPARGLVDVQVLPDGPVFEQLLGVEIVDAVGLGPHPLFEVGEQPEVVCRQDIALAIYKPTPARPVECHARWRVAGERTFELEISTLTPGQWGGLSVRTCSLLPPGELVSLPDAPVVIHRPADAAVSYIEMCHPHDTAGFDVGTTGVLRFRLFGYDLEKGVILRGRLRGIIVDRPGDLDAARAAYEQLLREPPHLSA